MLCTCENSDVFNTLDEIYLVFTSKKVNILYVPNMINKFALQRVIFVGYTQVIVIFGDIPFFTLPSNLGVYHNDLQKFSD